MGARLAVWVTFGFVLSTAVPAAKAAAIIYDETIVNDRVQVTCGTLVTLNSGEFGSCDVPIPSSPGFMQVNIMFIEGGGPISDILQLAFSSEGPPTLSTTFNSDGDPVPVLDPLPANPPTIINVSTPETPGKTDILPLLPQSFRSQLPSDLSITVINDTDIPEPASLALLAGGLMVFLWSRKRILRSLT